jgi:predicted pyridoxine 5'-phosphate oxidase superfamily flavin-nucleotide-binding protein
VAFADLAGNNRLDTYANITHDPHVGLLCVVPGVEETLRLNGSARLSTDPEVLDATAIDGRRPKVAVVIGVTECYIHCAKALRRAGLWDPASWPAGAERPSAAEILKDHLDLEVDAQLIADDLEAGYQATIWEHGGE